MLRKFIFLIVLSLISADFMFSQSETQSPYYTVYAVDRNTTIEQISLAQRFIAQEYYSDAIALLLETSKNDSILRESYFEIFNAAVLSKNTSDSVLSCLQKGLRIFNDDDEMYYFNGEFYRLKSEYSKAIGFFDKAISLSDSIPQKSILYFDYFKSRAICHFVLQDYKSAIVDYTEFINNRRLDAQVYLNRGICFSNTGNKKLAIADFKRAVNLGDKTAKIYLEKLTKP